MRVWQIVVPGLVGMALAGCRNDPSIALLERDNFKKEQEIYRLRSRIEELEETLDASAPTQPAVTRGTPPGELPSVPGVRESGRSSPAATRPAPPFSSRGRATSEPEAPPPGGLQISPGTEAAPGEIPDRMRVPDNTTPPRPVSPPSGPSSDGRPSSSSTQWRPTNVVRPAGASSPVDNSSVAQITLHPALTGGIGSGGQPGDEGILVVVEPRDFGGNIINAPGDISVALFDPALSGQQARLARWDFSAVETESLIRTGSQQGVHIRVPWNFTPAHDRLKVFVRYSTRDGRKLQAERLISVALNSPPRAQHDVIPDTVPAQTASRPQRPQWSPLR